MFVILLKFSENKAHAADHMEGHKDWLNSGFSEGVFLIAGSLQPGVGGAILAHNSTLQDLETRVNQDPFVTENVVSAEILEISASRADPRLQFLLE